MKFLIVFVALFAVALAAAPRNIASSQTAEILQLESDVGPESFKYAFATSDGTSAQQEGEVHNIGREDEAIAVRGAYSFVADDGLTYTVTYVADENGFQPQGAHLPVAPQA